MIHTDSTATLLDSYYYQRNAEGKITAVYNDLPRATIESAIAGNQTSTLSRDLFSYDVLDRLVSEMHFNANESTPYHQVDYEWDLVGNLHEKIVTKSAIVEQSSFSYNDRDELIDEVFALNGTTQWTGNFDYDLQGNLTLSERGDTTIAYEYDIRNRLASATNTTNSVTTTAEYQYDHDGMQVRRTETTGGNSATEFLVRDPLSPYGYSRVLEKRTPSGILLASFVHGRQPIAEVTATSKHYLLADAHSGVRTIVDASNQAIQIVAYDSFGGLLTPAPTISSDHLYRTETFDSVSGQYYLRARHYTPSLTTFSQQDPYAGDTDNPLSMHRFQFADRDGVQKHDPTGMFSVSISLGTIAIAGGQLAKAYNDVRQGDRVTALHIANLVVQSMAVNFVVTSSEESMLARHLPKAGLYWSSTLHPTLYKNAGKLNLTPRRLAKATKIMAGLYVNQAKAAALGIPLKLNGFPAFSGLQYQNASLGIRPWDSSVFMTLRGSRSRDNTAARNLMQRHHPLFRPSILYSWHHHEIVGIMQYVARGNPAALGVALTVGHSLLGHGGGIFFGPSSTIDRTNNMKAIEQIIAALESPDRKTIVNALLNLQDGSLRFREKAIHSIGRILFDSEDENIQAHCLQLLGDIGGKDSVRILQLHMFVASKKKPLFADTDILRTRVSSRGNFSSQFFGEPVRWI